MISPALVEKSLLRSLDACRLYPAPYSIWMLGGDVFPSPVVGALRDLVFPVTAIGGVSGRRELHNDQRHYFDQASNARFGVCAAVAAAFQSPRTVAALARTTNSALDGTYVRIEYAQDSDGFWLEPHTDLGVKRFTMLYFLSDGPGHAQLGTDIYADRGTHVARLPFNANTAAMFVPSDRSWHGFGKRPIPGVRKSVIINYVTGEWRARDQLAFPDAPVRAAPARPDQPSGAPAPASRVARNRS